MNFLLNSIQSLMNSILIILPTTLIAIMGHEIAHGWASIKLGDPTPKFDGRMSLNPLKHLDPVGTVLMLLTGFGWAKPVMVNPMYYKDRKKGMAVVALAGPAANFLMAVIGAAIGMLIIRFFGATGNVQKIVFRIITIFVYRNLAFMVFNLIPLPPLDGSKVLGMFLPDKIYYTMLQYERYCIYILMILVLGGAFDKIIGAGMSAAANGIFNFLELIIF